MNVCVCVSGMRFSEDAFPANVRVITGKKVKNGGKKKVCSPRVPFSCKIEWYVSQFPISGLCPHFLFCVLC